jgi:hypothetical protein
MSKGQHQYATNYKQETMLRLSEEKICSSAQATRVRPFVLEEEIKNSAARKLKRNPPRLIRWIFFRPLALQPYLIQPFLT